MQTKFNNSISYTFSCLFLSASGFGRFPQVFVGFRQVFAGFRENPGFRISDTPGPSQSQPIPGPGSQVLVAPVFWFSFLSYF